MTSNVPELTTAEVLQKTTGNMIAALAGMLTAEPKDFILSAGRLLQSVVSGRFMEQLGTEWEEYKKKGQIPEDYEKSVERLTCLQELFDFLDKDIPDDVRLDAIKRIFIVAAIEYKSAPDKYLPAEYMRLAKRLEPGELIFLKSIHTLLTSGKNAQTMSSNTGIFENWVKEVSASSVLKHSDLGKYYCEKLREKRLVNPAWASDGSGIALMPHYGLTEYGFVFCEYLARYKPASK